MCKQSTTLIVNKYIASRYTRPARRARLRHALLAALCKAASLVVRILYRWKVELENFEAFEKAWRRATNTIHETVPGALGSFMLRQTGNETEILTVAKWDSVESWEAFWGAANPQEMEGMHKLGHRVCVTLYDEIEDFTR